LCPSLLVSPTLLSFLYFFPPPTPNIYTLSLHDALPISPLAGKPSLDERISNPPGAKTAKLRRRCRKRQLLGEKACRRFIRLAELDRKSTRLNSSHVKISYAVFCLKKKNHTSITHTHITT